MGPVRVTAEGRAEITARDICQPEFDHLWVSAKQVADRRPDPALQEEGSSGISAGWWSQKHPLDFTCDGEWHTDTFVIGDEGAVRPDGAGWDNGVGHALGGRAGALRLP